MGKNLFFVSLLAGLSSPAAAQILAQADISQMSIEQLSNVEITSVSKVAQPLSAAAAPVYATTFYDRASDTPAGANGHDGWSKPQGGFRLDWTPSGGDRVMLSGEIFGGTAAQPGASNQRVSGGNVIARWDHPLEEGSSLSVQAYYDQMRRDDSRGGQPQQPALPVHGVLTRLPRDSHSQPRPAPLARPARQGFSRGECPSAASLESL